MTATKPRIWTVDRDPDTGLVDRDQALQAYLELEAIQARLGGAVVVTVERTEIAPNLYANTRLVFRWESFVPITQNEPEPAFANGGDPED